MSDRSPCSALEAEFKRLCGECEHLHQWATQANVAVRVEYNKTLDHLRDKKDNARQRLAMLAEGDAHLQEHMIHAAERAIEEFRFALADAKSKTESARSKPPFLY